MRGTEDGSRIQELEDLLQVERGIKNQMNEERLTAMKHAAAADREVSRLKREVDHLRERAMAAQVELQGLRSGVRQVLVNTRD